MRPLCFYYPSTVAIVDDNERFLSRLSLSLDTKLPYIPFTQPTIALEYIQKNHLRNQTAQVLVENIEADNFGLKSAEHQMKVDFSHLYEKIYDPKRFTEPTAVVVDYSMPSMNGYDFCKLLKSNAIKKIMLTGEADDKLAIELFNEGVLNKFVLKSTPEFWRLINNAVLELQKAYFVEKSQTLIDILKSQSQFYIEDNKVAQLFSEICEKYNIAEYYMINATGNFLLLDYDGVPYYFLIVDENELRDLQEIAEDQKASPAIQKALKNGECIPYFTNNSELMDAQGNNWETFLHPAKKIVGDKTYYYAWVKDANILNIQRDKILSFKQYLENTWPPVSAESREAK